MDPAPQVAPEMDYFDSSDWTLDNIWPIDDIYDLIAWGWTNKLCCSFLQNSLQGQSNNQTVLQMLPVSLDRVPRWSASFDGTCKEYCTLEIGMFTSLRRTGRPAIQTRAESTLQVVSLDNLDRILSIHAGLRLFASSLNPCAPRSDLIRWKCSASSN